MHVLLKIGGPRCVTYFRWGPEMCDKVWQGGGASKLVRNSVTYFMDGPEEVTWQCSHAPGSFHRTEPNLSGSLKLLSCVRFNDLRDFRMMGTQVLVFKIKLENFIYHKFKIVTGGAYAPYAPCMGTPLTYAMIFFGSRTFPPGKMQSTLLK